jgi:hypothetical protein
VRVQADVPQYTDAAIETLTLAAGETQTVEQNPPLLPGVLERLDEAKSAELHLRVDYLKEGEQRLIYEGTQPMTVWARGEVGLGSAWFLQSVPLYGDPRDPERSGASRCDPIRRRSCRATELAI